MGHKSARLERLQELTRYCHMIMTVHDHAGSMTMNDGNMTMLVLK